MEQKEKGFKYTFKWFGSLSFQFLIEKWLFLSSFFSCTLLLIRIIVTGSFAFIFLTWNLFLAFIPYWITSELIKNTPIAKKKFKLAAMLAVWLLFIPNSFYIITDLFHLSRFNSAPKWFDVLMLFSFAWNGILFGIISVRRIEMLFLVKRKNNFSLLLVFTVM